MLILSRFDFKLVTLEATTYWQLIEKVWEWIFSQYLFTHMQMERQVKFPQNKNSIAKKKQPKNKQNNNIKIKWKKACLALEGLRYEMI